MNFSTLKKILIGVIALILIVGGIKVYFTASDIAEKYNTDVSTVLGIGGFLVLLIVLGAFSQTVNNRSKD